MSQQQRQRHSNWSTRALRVDAKQLAVKKFRVEVISGRDQGAIAAGSATELGIGTAVGNQLLVTDGAVSRHHCVIEATAKGFQLRDLGSTNGTFLGGHRVQIAYVEPQDIISVGETSLRFECDESEETSQPLSATEEFGGVLGVSAAMRRIFAMLTKLASNDATVLLMGETGTGKGALAEAMHRMSSRRDQPFVVVDCGAIPENLIESELFGHERGSFTGADRKREGAFVTAHGGTLFLDEIGELGIDLQPKLLRVLENREVRPVGSSTTQTVDVRIVAATNRDLRQEVNSGNFRSDLFYRLNVMRVDIPPLRERREDIPLLAASFYRHFSKDPKVAPPPDLLARMLRQPWPGNVRELRAAVERSIVLGDMSVGQIVSSSVSPEFDYTISYRDAKDHAIARWEERYIPELVERYEGNLSRAARAVAMDRNHLRKLLRRYRGE